MHEESASALTSLLSVKINTLTLRLQAEFFLFYNINNYNTLAAYCQRSCLFPFFTIFRQKYVNSYEIKKKDSFSIADKKTRKEKQQYHIKTPSKTTKIHGETKKAKKNAINDTEWLKTPSKKAINRTGRLNTENTLQITQRSNNSQKTPR